MKTTKKYPYGIVNNIEFLDENPTTMRCVSCQLYIELNRDTKECHASDYIALEIHHTTRGKLKEVNQALGEKLEKYFNVKLEEYGVKTVAIEDITVPEDYIEF